MIFIVRDEHNETRDKVSKLSFRLSIGSKTWYMRRWLLNMSWIFTWTDLTLTVTKMAMLSVRYLWIRWRHILHIVKGITSASSIQLWLILFHSKCAPRLSAEAQEMLSSHFVSLRKQVQQVERDNDERSSIPITIRSAIFFIFSFLSLVIYAINQSTRGYHTDIWISSENDPLNGGPAPSRGGGHSTI